MLKNKIDTLIASIDPAIELIKDLQSTRLNVFQFSIPMIFKQNVLDSEKNKQRLTLLMHGGIPVIHLGKTSLDSCSSFCTSLP